MRYLIDTNIFVYLSTDPDLLSRDVLEILEAPETVLCISTESLKEQQGHKDPSDHAIIAQALTERIPLISSDTRFDFYRKQGLDLIFNKK